MKNKRNPHLHTFQNPKPVMARIKPTIDNAVIEFIFNNKESIESYSLESNNHEIKLNIKLAPKEKIRVEDFII